MKKGAILTILLSCLCFSCSMVDETALDAASKGNSNITENDTNVAFSVSLSLADLKTRVTSVSPGEDDNVTEMNIKNGVVFLLVKAADNTYNVETAVGIKIDATSKTANAEFFTKSGSNKYLYAVANVSEETSDNRLVALKACETLAEVEALALNKADLKNYPKATVEPVAVNFNDAKLFKPETDEAGRPVLTCIQPISLTVEQRTARIELEEFIVTKASPDQKDLMVYLKKVELINSNIAGKVGKNVTATPDLMNFSTAANFSLEGKSGNLIKDDAIIPFESFAYTYKNTETSKQLSLCLTYCVGKGIDRTATLPIHGIKSGDMEALAGYIYKVKVKATVRPEQQDIVVRFWINPWIDGGSLGEWELQTLNN